MDGNGRWAIARGKVRLAGHRAGADALDRVLGFCKEAGVQYMTVYAFSTENWKRPVEEVSGLMRLLGTFIRNKEKQLIADKVRFRVIGRRSDLSPTLQKKIAALEKKTEKFEQQLIVALSYGGRAEIVDAAIKFSEKVSSLPEGKERAKVAEQLFAECMYAPDVPDPDLIIRTSGEFRLSNFLLWQCAYSEFYMTDVLWPDFSKEDFNKALESYSARDRRMGGHK